MALVPARGVCESPRARDPARAEQAQFEAAVASRDNAALIAFIARFPEGALPDTARALLRERPRPDPAPGTGPDADIIFAFDRARSSRDHATLADFARLFAGHPLAAEAQNPVWTAP